MDKIKDLITGYDGWGPDYYDDGVITYTAKKRSHFDKAFRKLERTLGIETQRVSRKSNADIICRYGDPGNGWSGVHQYRVTRKGRPYSNIIVDPGNWYTQSTVVHEIGHALGMAHPNDHSRTDTIMSYGAPGDLPWFTKLDRKVLDYLYN